MLNKSARAVIFGAGNRGVTPPAGPSEPFYAEVTPVDFVADMGFVVVGGTVDVDWGNGSFVTGLSGTINSIPLSPGPVVIKSNNTITQITFDYLSGNGWPAGANYKNIDIINSSTLTSADNMCAFLPLLETFTIDDGSNLTTCYWGWINNYALTSFNVTNLDLSSSTRFDFAWRDCWALATFPADIDMTAGTDYVEAWASAGIVTMPNVIFTDGSSPVATRNGSRMWRHAPNLLSTPDMDLTGFNRLDEAWDDCAVIASIGSVISPDVTDFTNAFSNCPNLVCIAAIDSDGLTGTEVDMFLNTPSLVAPDAAEQILLANAPGLAYVNPGACP